MPALLQQVGSLEEQVATLKRALAAHDGAHEVMQQALDGERLLLHEEGQLLRDEVYTEGCVFARASQSKGVDETGFLFLFLSRCLSLGGGFPEAFARIFSVFLAMIAYSIIAVRVHIAYVQPCVRMCRISITQSYCVHRSRKSRRNIRKSCAYWSGPTLLSSTLWYDIGVVPLCAWNLSFVSLHINLLMQC